MAVYQRKDTKARRWFYKFTIDGVTYKKAIPTARTKRDAETAERAARRDVHEGTYGIPKDILFSEFVNKYYLPWAEQHRKGIKNIEYRAEVFCEFFKGYTLRRIGPILIEKYKLNRLKTPMEYDAKRTRMPSTINTELITLSAIFTRALAEGRIRENPCRKVEKLPVGERKPRVLMLEEEPKLLRSAESGPFYLAPVIQLGLWLGWRENELLHIRKCDIDFIRNRIYVSRAKWAKDPRLTKGVPMSAAVRELLLQLVEKAKGEYVFARPQTGKPYLRGCLQMAFKTACRKAKSKVYDFTICGTPSELV